MKILIVDDSKAMRQIVKRTIRQAGFGDAEVREAASGAEAELAIEEHVPDIVLLDLNITEVNGYEVLRELRDATTTKNLPVILLTGVSPTEGEQTAVDLGANHYVTKPCKLSSLRAVIRVAMREVGNSAWTKPPTDQIQNVNQFQVN